MTVQPHRPLQLRLLAGTSRVMHRLTGGRVGSLEAGTTAPRGRALEIITAVHRGLYRATRGFIGGEAGGLSTLLLTTTGKKTGQPRTVPLPYFMHGDDVVVVASFAGNAKNPAWFGNLVAKPEVDVQIKGRRFRAVAKPAGPEERPAIWASVLAAAPMYADYQRVTPREIPVVVLQPKR